jgi:hypothetical protein
MIVVASALYENMNIDAAIHRGGKVSRTYRMGHKSDLFGRCEVTKSL